MKTAPPDTPLSLTDARTGRRVRLRALPTGAALVEPILGYCYQVNHLTVYVNGSMPLDLRAAQEEGRTQDEVWLVEPRPAGIREIDWTDCRGDYRLLLPETLKKAA